MMQRTIPAHLVSTYQLLKCAFPEGIAEQEYLPLLSILYEEMSDRSLAQVIIEFTDREYPAVLNDIYRIGAADTSLSGINAVIERVKQKLIRCNYEQWLLEN